MTKPMTPQEVARAVVDRETVRTRLFYSGYSTIERQAIEQLAAAPDEPSVPRTEQLFRNTTNGHMYRLWGDVSDCSEGVEDEKRMMIYSHHDDSEPKFARESSDFRTYFKPIDKL